MSSKKVKNFFKKFWFLLWKDNSFKGWIFSLMFIFVFIRFLFFPLLALTTGTSLPLAIVESCSMYHQGNIFSDFNSWFQRHDLKYEALNITEQQFDRFSLHNGFGKGDILFIVVVKPQNIHVGDIIVYNAQQQAPIIHRVINITNNSGTYFFSTEGDNNNGQLSFENGINQNQIIGKASFMVAPYIGWIKLIFYQNQEPVYERGSCSETPSS